MTWNYAYTPSIWPSVLTVLLLIALSIYSGRRRSVPGALPFAVGCLFAAAWVTGSVMQAAAVDLEAKIAWFKFQSVLQLLSATAITCFALEYAWPGRWLTRRNLILLSIPCVLGAAVALTNDLYHLAWHGFIFDRKIIPLRTGFNWAFIIYGYLLAIVPLVVFSWLFLRSPQQRWPAAIMLTGQFVARTLFMLEATLLLQPPLPLNLPPVAFEYLMYAIALYGFRIFDPIALARQSAIAQMHEGMLVLDPQGQVVDLNPAAEQLFCLPASRARGQLVSELIPAYPDGPPDDSGGNQVEVSMETGPETNTYQLETSVLKDWHGLEIGRLLLLHDVTAQKQAQARLLEQQRILAMLQERERLAREMHDSLGQSLAAAHLQASSARLLLARDEIARTDECLESLEDLTLAAESDVREYLLGAKTVFSAGLPFFPALRQYVLIFSQQYGLQVELSVPPQLEAAGLGPSVEMQLQRIIQEALSNVRKHACAESVQIIFTVSGPRVQVAIRDDGQGFDRAAAAQLAGGFGLQSMRERAEGLGGCLEVISQPGQGTQVIVQVPVGEEAVKEGRGDMEIVK